MKKPLLIYFLFMGIFSVCAQKNQIFSAHIQTLQVKVNNNWLATPVLTLNSNDVLEVSFDELSHQYHRFQYVISHCNSDWTVSGLSEIDFLEGFNNNPIEQYQNSINTTMLYTHYRLILPNEQVRFKISGNYKVDIYDENDDQNPICQAYFYVIDKKINIAATVTSNTEVDTNKSHQQVSFSINYAGYSIRNPQDELKVYVFQNLRIDNCVTNIRPSYISANELRYEHNPNLVFEAGNEYRRFEMVSVRQAAQGIQSIQFHDPYYHVTLYPDMPRTKNYSFDKDQNGRYLIRYDWATDNDTEADYHFVHFSLPWKGPLPDGQFYLNGELTNSLLNDKYQLQYNPTTESYETMQLIKQGAYNYQYLFVPSNGGKATTALTEGNYYETENEYMILVYHRPFGERYDRLIGVKQLFFK